MPRHGGCDGHSVWIAFNRQRLEAEERSGRRDIGPGRSIEQPRRQRCLLTRVLSNRDVPFFAGRQQDCTDRCRDCAGDYSGSARSDQIEDPIRPVSVRVADIPEAANLREHDQNATFVATPPTHDEDPTQ